MSKCLCKCGYCGIRWIDNEPHGWRSKPRACPHCNERKNIELKELGSEGIDVFGYRFSPAFPPKLEPYFN